MVIPGVEVEVKGRISQRTGNKARELETKSKSKMAAKALNTLYIKTATAAFNQLPTRVREAYLHKETFKQRLETFLADIEVLENDKPLKRTALFTQLKAYNYQYRAEFIT